MTLRIPKNAPSAGFSLHPQDPRIAVAGDIESFRAACLSDAFRAALFRRGENEKQKLQAIFESVFDRNAASPTGHVEASVKNGRVRITRIPETYKPLRREFSDMLRMYHELTGHPEVQLLAFRGLGARSMHTHTKDFMNATWMNDGFGGTEWPNERNEIVQADEGDWFFFKAGFRHRSPARTNHRVTLVMFPPNPSSE